MDAKAEHVGDSKESWIRDYNVSISLSLSLSLSFSFSLRVSLSSSTSSLCFTDWFYTCCNMSTVDKLIL